MREVRGIWREGRMGRDGRRMEGGIEERKEDEKDIRRGERKEEERKGRRRSRKRRAGRGGLEI